MVCLCSIRTNNIISLLDWKLRTRHYSWSSKEKTLSADVILSKMTAHYRKQFYKTALMMVGSSQKRSEKTGLQEGGCDGNKILKWCFREANYHLGYLLMASAIIKITSIFNTFYLTYVSDFAFKFRCQISSPANSSTVKY